MKKENNKPFLFGLTVTILFLASVCCFCNDKQAQSETITVVDSVEDVLSASRYQTEEVYTLVNDRVFLGSFRLTAYCGCYECSGEWGNGTATGTVAKANHTIAVDPDVIPYGTEVYINGIKYVAEDCGGAIKGNRIDVYYESHAEAVRFGVQYADVFILM